MNAGYAPGTPAIATVGGVPDVRLFRREPPYPWASVVKVNGRFIHDDEEVTDVHPLVVLDLPDTAGVLATLQDAASFMLKSSINHDRLRDLIAQIEAQTKPPKPVEPTGLGAVVEDAEGTRWIGVGNGLWVPSVLAVGYASDERPRPYAEIDVVRVLSEGIQ